MHKSEGRRVGNAPVGPFIPYPAHHLTRTALSAAHTPEIWVRFSAPSDHTGMLIGKSLGGSYRTFLSLLIGRPECRE